MPHSGVMFDLQATTLTLFQFECIRVLCVFLVSLLGFSALAVTVLFFACFYVTICSNKCPFNIIYFSLTAPT